MKKSSREALDAYYAEAGSWAKDQGDALRASRRTAWWVAGGAAFIAVCEALALLFLTPLKSVEPYTLLVDRSEEHTSELQSLMRISYAVFCLQTKNSNKVRKDTYTNTKHKQ